MSVPADIKVIYERAEKEAGRWPYALGGGHNSTLSPSPPTIGGLIGPKGYDCSAYVMMLIHAGAPAEMPAARGPVWATYELEKLWGAVGIGEYLSVRVFNGIHNGHVVEHSLLEFRKGFPAAHRYAMAFHTNGPHANFVAESDFDTSFYHARRKIAA